MSPAAAIVHSADASGEDNDLVQEGIEGTAHVQMPEPLPLKKIVSFDAEEANAH